MTDGRQMLEKPCFTGPGRIRSLGSRQERRGCTASLPPVETALAWGQRRFDDFCAEQDGGNLEQIRAVSSGSVEDSCPTPARGPPESGAVFPGDGGSGGPTRPMDSAPARWAASVENSPDGVTQTDEEKRRAAEWAVPLTFIQKVLAAENLGPVLDRVRRHDEASNL